MSNALVNLEAQFPFNLVAGTGHRRQRRPAATRAARCSASGARCTSASRPTRTCSAYWDTVADRLFKIRNSENIQGVAQQLPLFDPPLDPGMLVQATAAGLDIGSIVSGLNQPIGPVRVAAADPEGAGDRRRGALARRRPAGLPGKGRRRAAGPAAPGTRDPAPADDPERAVPAMAARPGATNGLLKTRAITLERYTYYLRLLNLVPDPATVPAAFTPDRRELTEANFADTYNALVGEYDLPIAALSYNPLQLAHGTSPSTQSGATGQGQLYLNKNEDAELNTHLPAARDARIAANTFNAIAAVVEPIPSAEAHLAFWGMGVHSKLFSGEFLAGMAKFAADLSEVIAGWQQDQAGIAARTAGYQRRADEWTLQANLAARELAQIGRQIIASLIAEQVAHHEYLTVKTQVQQAQDVQSFLKSKFTSAALLQLDAK